MLTDEQYLELEEIKKDLKWQLTFEDIDWGYFRDTTLRAKMIVDLKID